MSTPSTPTAVTAATEEEVATVRCTNSKEAIKYEKDLCAAMEAALKCLQKGSDAHGRCGAERCNAQPDKALQNKNEDPL